MKILHLMASSAIVMMLAMPASAQTREMSISSDTTIVSPQLDPSYEPVRAVLVGKSESGRTAEYVTFDPRMTANGMIGKSVYNTAGKKIAKVDDIVLNQSGQATTIILSEGGFMGIGDKLAGFDYTLMTRRDVNGDVIMPMGEELIGRAVAYSFDPDDVNEDNTIVIPATSHRMSKILDADMVDVEGKVIANVDNVSLRGGQIDYLIANFGKTMGVGGKQAAVKANTVTMTGPANDVDFRLSADQISRFNELMKMDLSTN